MATKEVKLCDGKITVVVKSKYEVKEKDLPKNLPPAFEWLCNFSVTEPNKEHGRRVPDKYEIQVPEKDKTLIYWDGSQKVTFTEKEHSLKNIKKEGRKFKSAELDLADPPVGWD